jgi:poly-gamma-glutamate synthesis protein (capsule biosynthesis protein)
MNGDVEESGRAVGALPANARNPRELVRMPGLRAAPYRVSLWFLRVTGAWKYPVDATGDYEEMRFRDVLYWLYKAEHHVAHPESGADLPTYFRKLGTLPDTSGGKLRVERELSVSAVGDLMDHAYLRRSEELYRQASHKVFGADLPMGNLEAVVCERPADPPRFNGRTAPQLRIDEPTLDRLAAFGGTGFAFLSAACNHTLDFGAEGASSTVTALRSRGIAYHGVNESEADAQCARIINRRGIRIAIVSHTFGLNGWPLPPDRPWMVNRTRLNRRVDDIDFSRVERQIAHAHDEGADFIIAHLHWGMEFEHYPRTDQIDVAHSLAERGIDAIFGHHPHVIQPYEFYQTRRDPDRFVPVFYSLGNLTNPFLDSRLCRSLVARLELGKGRDAKGTVRTYVLGYQVDTIVQSVDLAAQRIELQLDGEAREREGVH